jgi:hypothetical protein
MKISALAVIGAAALSIGTGAALGTPTHTAVVKTLTVVMRDPGCHWFSVGPRFTTTATVVRRVRVLNLDEGTLKVVSRHVRQRIPVGKSIVLGHGRYEITMVGQAPDDNHLELTVG